MPKYEVDQALVDIIKAKINDARLEANETHGVYTTRPITIEHGENYARMGVIYASLLVEYFEEQLAKGNVVDIYLPSKAEWLAREEEESF
jgi:hypothetical protein